MHFQIKYFLRPNLRVSIPRKSTLGRTVTAAQQCGARAAGSRASADIKKYFAPQCRRSYASDSAYSRAFASARDDPGTFWGEVGKDITWFEPWSKTLHVEDTVYPNW